MKTLLSAFPTLSPKLSGVALIVWLPMVVWAGTPQEIVFPEIPNQLVSASPFEIKVSASSGLPVTLTLASPPGIANLVGGTVTLSGWPGSVTVMATQAGNSYFDPASEVYRTFSVGRAEERFVKIFASGYRSAGIRADGTLWAWGDNQFGKLGNGGQFREARPLQVGQHTDWVTVACGMNHTVGLRADGTLWAWGYNLAGQLGDGTRTNRENPVQIGSDRWKAVACILDGTFGIKVDGTLWAWGYEALTKLGLPITSNMAVPRQVGTEQSWSELAGADDHAAGLRSDGTLWTWGNNESGQLGLGHNQPGYQLPRQVGNRADWAQVACGYQFTHAIRRDGTLWAWGDNVAGQLGDGTAFLDRWEPVQVGSDSDWTSVSCGVDHALGGRRDGRLWAWGSNAERAVGMRVTSIFTSPMLVPQVNIKQGAIAVGNGHTLVVKDDDSLVTWGLNTYGQLGNGTATLNYLQPVKRDSSASWVDVASRYTHTLAVQEDGTLWEWGTYTAGASGDSFAPRVLHKTPTQVGTSNDWISVSKGDGFSAALQRDGSVWTWGQNHVGQLGNGSLTSGFVPVRMEVVGVWTAVTCGKDHAIGLQRDGSLWAWGSNQYGQLGDGSHLMGRSSPVQIGQGAEWKTAAAGYRHTLALRRDGTLWAWGSNNAGQLGTGTPNESRVPVQVGNANHWALIYAGDSTSAAIDASGRLWMWGAGLPTTEVNGPAVSSSVPVQVGTDHSWLSVGFGEGFAMAVRADGTLWSWGRNWFGALGDGTLTTRWHLAQVGAFTDWKAAAGGVFDSFGLRNDGSIWAWGSNNSYQVSESYSQELVRCWPEQAPQEISFAVPERLFVGQALLLPTAGSSGLPVHFYVSGPASVDGHRLTTTGPGVAVVTAYQDGDDSWAEADAVTREILITEPPDIAVLGGGLVIANGSTVTSTLNHTNFGDVPVRDTRVSQTFEIRNTGRSPLTLAQPLAITLSGPHAAEFSVTSVSASPIVVEGGSTTFTIQFDPAGTSTRLAVVHVVSDDPDETGYTFTLRGRGVEPKMAMYGNRTLIAHRDETPQEADFTDFGTVMVDTGTVIRPFVIFNGGTSALHLDGGSPVRVEGTHAQDFTVTTAPVTTVPSGAGGLAPFEIAFKPTRPGIRLAQIRISSDDPSTSDYVFTIQGRGKAKAARSQTISFTMPSTGYLGQGTVLMSAYASSGLPVDLSVLSGPATLTGKALTLTGIGTVQIQARQEGSEQFLPAAAVKRTLIVKASPAGLTLSELSQTYDGTPRAIRVSGASEPVSVRYLISKVWVATPPVDVGSYAVKADSGNQTKTATLVITHAPLRVLPDDQRKLAGQPNPELTYTLSGFVPGQTAAVLERLPVVRTTAAVTSAGGSFPITASGGLAANYAFVYLSGTLMVESFAGTYEGLLRDSTSQPVAKLRLVVAANSRSFTGTLSTSVETAPLLFAGALATDAVKEEATSTLHVTRGMNSYQIDLLLPISGAVTIMVWQNNGLLGETRVGRKLPVLKAVPWSGAHTVHLRAMAGDAADAPLGAGWAAANVASTGMLTLSGKLADNTAFSAALAPDGESDPGFRLFAQPYAPARAGAWVAGEFSLTPHPYLQGRRRVAGAPLFWLKTALPSDTSYREGFGPLNPILTLDPWRAPGGGVSLAQRLGLASSGIVAVDHTLTGSVSDPNLPTLVMFSNANTVSVLAPLTVPSNATKWKLGISSTTLTTGVFSGSFEVQDAGMNRLVPFSGIFRQPPENGEDHLFGGGFYILPALPNGTSQAWHMGQVLIFQPE